MNREIKFRAWHKNLKKMFKIGQITLEKGAWNFEPNDRDFIGMSIPFQPSFVLMQYTGLHDKNGKEIYEGDILKVYYKGMSEVGYVEYDNEYCEYKIIINTDKDYFSLWKSIDLEKIGNKYDNPELLGGE